MVTVPGLPSTVIVAPSVMWRVGVGDRGTRGTPTSQLTITAWVPAPATFGEHTAIGE
jgi:hypothetical protein